jgi:hypothetical protein
MKVVFYEAGWKMKRGNSVDFCSCRCGGTEAFRKLSLVRNLGTGLRAVRAQALKEIGMRRCR